MVPAIMTAQVTPLTLGFDIGQDARGLTANLTREYGLGQRDMLARATRYDGAETASGSDALNLKLGYGSSAWQGLLTPYFETGLDAGDMSSTRFGVNYTRGAASLSLNHTFRPVSGTAEDGHKLSLLGEIRF